MSAEVADLLGAADPEPPACPTCDDSGIRRRGPEVLPCHCTEVEE